MLLSRLAFEAIKASSLQGDNALSYSDYLSGNGATNNDYSREINLVFVPLNEFFQRLSSLGKLPYKVKNIGTLSESVTRIVNFSAISSSIKKIVNVFQFKGNNYLNIEFREMNNQLYLIGDWVSDENIYVQYEDELPYFNEDDLVALVDNDDGTTTDGNIDLRSEYGITNEMCVYAIEWCQGKLMEDASPSMSQMHINHVESYLAGLQTPQTDFSQNAIEVKYHL